MIIHSSAVAANPLPGTLAGRGKTLSKNSPAIGADQAQLTSVSKQDLTAAGAPIQDEDAAGETAEAARQMIIAQNAMAMLAQANSMPLSALRLLQQ
jgi:flagellin-like hook-associated protein FlgL